MVWIAVDWKALFKLLKWKKFTHASWFIFTCSLISSWLHGSLFSVWFSSYPSRSEEVSIRSPIWHGQCNLTVSEGNGTRGSTGFCHCRWTKGLQTTKAEKWGATSSLLSFGPVSYHIAPGICTRCLRWEPSQPVFLVWSKKREKHFQRMIWILIWLHDCPSWLSWELRLPIYVSSLLISDFCLSMKFFLLSMYVSQGSM